MKAYLVLHSEGIKMPRFLSVNAVGQNKHNMRIEVEDREMYLKNNLQQVWGKGDDQPPGWH